MAANTSCAELPGASKARFASNNLQGGLAHTILAHHSLQISLVQQQHWICACPVIPSAFLQTGECHLTSLQGQQAGRGLLLHLNPPKHPCHQARLQSSLHTQPKDRAQEVLLCFRKHRRWFLVPSCLVSQGLITGNTHCTITMMQVIFKVLPLYLRALPRQSTLYTQQRLAKSVAQTIAPLRDMQGSAVGNTVSTSLESC